jgi:C-terminal peptidase prc
VAATTRSSMGGQTMEHRGWRLQIGLAQTHSGPIGPRVALVAGLSLGLLTSGTVAQARPAAAPLRAEDITSTVDWICKASLSNLSPDKLLAAINAAVRAQLISTHRDLSSTKADPKSELDELMRLASQSLPAAEAAQRRSLLLRNALQAALLSTREEGTRLQLASQYIAPPEDEQHDRSGVGILVDPKPDRHGHFVVFEVLDGFPASKSGIRPGDQIVKVSGHPVAGASYHEVGEMILGRVGTHVVLTVQKPDRAAPQSIDIPRVWLNPNPKNVSSRLLDGDVGYIRFKYLGQRMDIELTQILRELQRKSQLKGLILDLRNNEGVLEGTLDVAGCFAPKGTKVTSLVSKTRAEDFRTTREPLAKVPLVLLVNRYTDGPGVLLAGALRDTCNAQIVGEPTVWRSQPTESHVLRDGSVASVCTGYYSLPAGQALRALRPAVEPGVRVEQSPLLPLGSDQDQQLRKALGLFRSTAP